MCAKRKGYARSQIRAVVMMMTDSGCRMNPCASGQYHQRIAVDAVKPSCVPTKRQNLMRNPPIVPS